MAMSEILKTQFLIKRWFCDHSDDSSKIYFSKFVPVMTKFQSASVAPLDCIQTRTSLPTQTKRPDINKRTVAYCVEWCVLGTRASEWLLSKCCCPLKSPANLPRSHWNTFRLCERLLSCGDIHVVHEHLQQLHSRFCYSSSKGGWFFNLRWSTAVAQQIFELCHINDFFLHRFYKQCFQVNFFPTSGNDQSSEKTCTFLMHRRVHTYLWFFLSFPQKESQRNQRRAPQDWPRWSGRTPVCIRVSVGQNSHKP